MIMLAVLMTAVTVSGQRLWRVSGNNAKGTTYLLGTHHIAPVDILERTPGFDAALAGVDVVIGELEMAGMTDPSLQARLMTLATAPADSTLTRLLSPSQIDSLNTVLARYTGGMLTAGQLDMLKPMMVNTQLAVMQSMLVFPDFKPEQQLDAVVQTRATEAGKPVEGFETIVEQMELLLADPLTVQASDLMKSVAKDAQAADAARDLARAYEKGDLEELAALMFDPEIGFTPDTAERLLYRRNRAWIERLLEELPRRSSLVTVGIGHFIGDKGLIEGLRRAGYTVEPVK